MTVCSQDKDMAVQRRVGKAVQLASCGRCRLRPPQRPPAILAATAATRLPEPLCWQTARSVLADMHRT